MPPRLFPAALLAASLAARGGGTDVRYRAAAAAAGGDRPFAELDCGGFRFGGGTGCDCGTVIEGAAIVLDPCTPGAAVLALASAAAPAGLAAAYTAAQCTLRLSGTVAVGQYVAAIGAVELTQPLARNTTVTYSLGRGVYRMETGRWYEVAVAAGGMGWTAAQAHCAAAARDLFKLPGYLATAHTTAAAEVVRAVVDTAESLAVGGVTGVWLGGVGGGGGGYRWVTGPEGCGVSSNSGYERTSCSVPPAATDGTAVALPPGVWVGGAAPAGAPAGGFIHRVFGGVPAGLAVVPLAPAAGEVVVPLCEWGGLEAPCLAAADMVGVTRYLTGEHDECALTTPRHGEVRSVDPDWAAFGTFRCECQGGMVADNGVCVVEVVRGGARGVLEMMNAIALVGSVLGSGVLAPAAGRLAIVRSLHCPRASSPPLLPAVSLPLGFELHPTGVAVGDDPAYSHVVGAVLLNCACVAAVAVVAEACIAVGATRRAAAATHVAYVALLQGTAFAAARLVFAGSDAGAWVWLGWAVLCAAVASPLGLYGAVLMRVPQAAVFLDDPRLIVPDILLPEDPRSLATLATSSPSMGETTPTDTPASAASPNPLRPRSDATSTASRSLQGHPLARRRSDSSEVREGVPLVPYVGCWRSGYWCWFGAQLWRDDGGEARFCERHGAAFERLAGGRQWAPAVELTATNVVGILAGWEASGAECDARGYAIACVCAAWLAVLVCIPVYAAPFDSLVATTAAGLTAVGALCYTVAAGRSPGDERDLATVNATLMLTSAACVMGAKVLCDLVRLVADEVFLRRRDTLKAEFYSRRRAVSSPGAGHGASEMGLAPAPSFGLADFSGRGLRDTDQQGMSASVTPTARGVAKLMMDAPGVVHDTPLQPGLGQFPSLLGHSGGRAPSALETSLSELRYRQHQASPSMLLRSIYTNGGGADARLESPLLERSESQQHCTADLLPDRKRQATADSVSPPTLQLTSTRAASQSLRPPLGQRAVTLSHVSPPPTFNANPDGGSGVHSPGTAQAASRINNSQNRPNLLKSPRTTASPAPRRGHSGKLRTQTVPPSPQRRVSLQHL